MNYKENSIKFFLENVGTSYHPGRETPEQGTERLALELAEAEAWAVATGYCFHWRTDPYLTSKEFNSSKPYYPLWMVTMFDKDGGRVDTFGGVDFGRDGEPWGDSYRRLLEAQLALEKFKEVNPGKKILTAHGHSNSTARDWEMKAQGIESVIHYVVSKSDQDLLRKCAEDKRAEGIRAAKQAQPAPIPTSERLAAGRILTCVYCGHEYPQDTPAHGSKVLTDHISQCEKHPMRDVIDQRDKLKSALAGLIGASDSAELRNMELIIRLSPAPAADKAAMLDAIHVLLNVAEQPTGLTMPPAPTNKEQANAKDAD